MFMDVMFLPTSVSVGFVILAIFIMIWFMAKNNGAKGLVNFKNNLNVFRLRIGLLFGLCVLSGYMIAQVAIGLIVFGFMACSIALFSVGGISKMSYLDFCMMMITYLSVNMMILLASLFVDSFISSWDVVVNFFFISVCGWGNLFVYSLILLMTCFIFPGYFELKRNENTLK